MNGKLAKRIRRAVNLSPNAVRGYRETNHTKRVEYTGRMLPNETPELTWMAFHTAVATGNRAAYQNLKASVHAAKRNGDGWEGGHA